MSNSLSQLRFWKTFFTPNHYSHDQIPNLTGKVAIVTGANTGLGYCTTVALAAHGAHVFMAYRSQQRATDAIERAKAEIKEKYPQAADPKLDFLELDLNDMRKARDAAKKFLAKDLPLHILVCNSGIMASLFELSADGIETQFAINHMGHFVFTMGLLDRIKKSQPSRIVIVSSNCHELTVPGAIDFDTLNDETKTDSIQRYARSKLANILFTKALARRLENERVYVNAVHPGYVFTDLSRGVGASSGAILKQVVGVTNIVVAVKPEVGCLTQLYAAMSTEIEEDDIRGRYFIPIANEILPSEYARDEELQEKLWTFSEKLVNEKIGGL
ncbi:hypothetical protein BGX21_004915 [Mortierella sp. AD011]|nr:hypothetical protein BGX20_007902 [Mortierella sp. AD010]KAF9403373.1 hypothetical protein BGX21_004915 [Mortierella sp. AD011]